MHPLSLCKHPTIAYAITALDNVELLTRVDCKEFDFKKTLYGGVHLYLSEHLLVFIPEL